MRVVYLAIDGHARHSTLGCMSKQGQFERSWTFDTSEKELVRHVKGIGQTKKVLAIEEGPLAFWMAQTLRPHVAELIIADPRENRLISRHADKNDKVDVQGLCRLLRLMAIVDGGRRTFTWWVTDHTLADGKRVSGGAGSPQTVTLTSEFPVPEKPYLERIVQWDEVDGSYPYAETVSLGSFLVQLPGSPELTLSVK